MNKMELILEVAQKAMQVAKDLRSLSDSVYDLCNFIVEGLSVEPKVNATPVKKEVPVISLDKVRGVLATKSQEGYGTEVKALITKYGASRLSEIKQEDYAEVLKEAEAIGNG